MSVYKYARWSFGDVEALLNAIGEDNALALKSGDLTVERVGQTLQIKEAVRPLFDRHGRRIPPQGLKAAVCDPNREFHLDQPTINYAQRLERLVQYGPYGTYFQSAGEFEERSGVLHQQIRADEQLANLLKGVCLPVCLPWMKVPDYGQALEEIFIASAGRAYKAQFPERPFTNYRQGQLQGQVTIVDGSRHERLLTRMAEGPVPGLYFPNPLQGYSVHAQREQMATLPESLLLAGGFETAAVWAMYLDVLARDYQTPGYDCSAVQWRSSEYSLIFKASVDWADFDSRADLSYAYDNYSGGLLFFG